MRTPVVGVAVIGPYAQLTLQAPAIARRAQPGQFVEIAIGGEAAPFWRRPFSICRVKASRIQLLVKAVGRGSRWLTQRQAGDGVDVVGPLGKGFHLAGSKQPWILIGGGFGIAPLLFLAERLHAKKIPCRVLMGGRCREDLLLRPEFKSLGVAVQCATEDGSLGVKGKVTDLLQRQASALAVPPRIAAAGPQRMLAAVARWAEELGLDAEVSLEEVMACGLGVCNGCVVKVQGAYRRVCQDGPVFSARDVEWEA